MSHDEKTLNEPLKSKPDMLAMSIKRNSTTQALLTAAQVEQHVSGSLFRSGSDTFLPVFHYEGESMSMRCRNACASGPIRNVEQEKNHRTLI
jgi:hypothetical protein